MSNVYRIYGIEFVPCRYDITFPLFRGESSEDQLRETGYQAGINYLGWCNNLKKVSELSILDYFKISETNPLEMKFQDAVLFGDTRVCQFVSDFLYGMEAASNAKDCLIKAERGVMISSHVALTYGVTSYEPDLLLKELAGNLEHKLVWGGAKNMESTISDMLCSAVVVSNKGYIKTHVGDTFGVSVQNTLEQIMHSVTYLKAHTKILAGLVEDVMYQQFRNHSKAKLLESFYNDNETGERWPNIHTM